MMHDSLASEEATLYCPVCDYNLTGLIENRCPECGQPFDPVELRRRLAEAREGEQAPPPEPLSTVGVIAWMAVYVVIAWVLTWLVVGSPRYIDSGSGYFALIFLVGGLFAAIRVRRGLVLGMAMARAMRERDASLFSMRTRTMRGWSAFLLFVLLFMQWIVPAIVLWVYMMSL